MFKSSFNVLGVIVAPRLACPGRSLWEKKESYRGSLAWASETSLKSKSVGVLEGKVCDSVWLGDGMHTSSLILAIYICILEPSRVFGKGYRLVLLYDMSSLSKPLEMLVEYGRILLCELS